MSSVVSLDIGSSALAGAEVKPGGALARAAVQPLPDGLVADGEVLRPAELATHIKRFWKSSGFSGKKVRLGVANQRVVVRTIELPAIDDPEERRAAVQFEAAEQIPIPSDQAVVDFQPVQRFDHPSGPRERMVLVAAHREMIEALVSTVRKAGLQPVGVDLEAFALLRALLPPPAVLDDAAATAQVVCHVGATTTNIIFAVDRQCQFTRMVGFGGVDLTNAVMEQTGLEVEEAEGLKRACGLLGDVPAGWDAPTAAKVRHALALAVRPLVQEISRSIDFYRSQEHASPVDRLILSGGTSLCAGLDRYAQQALGVPVELGDPLQNVTGGADVSPDVASRAAVAVGLALDAPEAQ